MFYSIRWASIQARIVTNGAGRRREHSACKGSEWRGMEGNRRCSEVSGAACCCPIRNIQQLGAASPNFPHASFFVIFLTATILAFPSPRKDSLPSLCSHW